MKSICRFQIMKILSVAINAKYIHSNLAVYSLHAYAALHGIETEYAEYTINQRLEHIFEDLYRKAPDVLCFSCYIWNIEAVKELAEEYHRLRPGVPIWVGGPEVSFETEAFLKDNPSITGIMVGEGEQTFLELCRYYYAFYEGRYVSGNEHRIRKFCSEANGSAAGLPAKWNYEHSSAWNRELNAHAHSAETLSEIRGLVFRSPVGKGMIRTPFREVLSMDALPFVYAQEKDGKLIPDPMLNLEHRIIYYETSRGCPFRCSYCLSSVDKQLRFRSLTKVFRELSFFLDRKVQQVKFVDRTFNCDRERSMAIWSFLLEHDNGVTNFHFETAADLMTEEEIALIAKMRPGLIQLEIGVQTTNPATIREIHRKMNLERVKQVVSAVKKGNNIHQHLDLIAGLPEEDFDTFRKSFDEIYALYPDQLQLGFLKVLKGSYMFSHAEDYGMISHSRPPYEVLKTRWLSFDDILRIRDVEEMLEMYYNSGQFAVSILLLEKLFDSAFTMFLELGKWYRESGFSEKKLTRLDRAEALLAFFRRSRKNSISGMKGSLYEGKTGERCSPEKADRRQQRQEKNPETRLLCFQEALLFDLCRIENIKKRPEWAPDLRPYRKNIMCFQKEHGFGNKYVRMERFHFDFLKEKQERADMTDAEQRPFWILFDYEHRNPLTNEAAFLAVSEDEISGLRL